MDGGYGSWQEWSECSKTCGRNPGIKTRVRLCNNPEPQNSGKDCSSLGEDSETASCRPKAKRCPGNYGRKIVYSPASFMLIYISAPEAGAPYTEPSSPIQALRVNPF